MVNEEKRSSQIEMPLTNAAPGASHTPLGARQDRSVPLGGGGGYLDICSVSELELAAQIRRADPRLRELIDMGVGAEWLRVAEAIGVESFLIMWALLGGDSSYRIRVPTYSRYLKFQRNKRIRALAANGHSSKHIQHLIVSEFRERVSIRHIDRLCAESKDAV